LQSPVEIITSRLRLVPVTPGMVEAFFQSRRSLGALIGARVPVEWPADPVIMEILRKQVISTGAPTWKDFIYVSREGLIAIGDGGFKGPTGDGNAEMGYSIIAPFRGKGLATEAANGLLKYAFNDSNMSSVTAETSPGNLESAAILRKIGMSRRGERHSEEDGELDCWSISREEYAGKHAVSETVKRS